MNRITPARWWPFAAALTLLLASQAALGMLMLHGTGGHLVYPLDDTYIQMAIAKNLAAHGTWGVTRFEFSGAGSSPAWPLLIAGLDRLSGLGPRLPLLANVLAAMLGVALAAVMSSRYIANRGGQTLTLMLVIVAAPLPALTLLGMEHTLQIAAALALTLAGVSWCAAPPAQDERWPWRLTLLALCAVAVRYETASIVVALALLGIGTRGWRQILSLILGSAAAPLAYAAMARRHGWPWLPAPILLKQRLSGLDLRSWHGIADLVGGGALTVLVTTPALLVLVIGAAALIAAGSATREDRLARESQLLLVVFLIATAIHLQFGRVGWLYRYEAYLVVLGVLANAAGLARVLPARWPRLGALRGSAIAILAIVLLQPLFLRAYLASRDVVASAADLYRHEYGWAQFFQQYPPDGGLLVSDVGAVAYFTDVPIVDAGGLATVELLPPRWVDSIDVAHAVRVARSRGVLVSIVDGPRDGPLTGWPCVAAWTAATDTTPHATVWLAADNPAAAAHLARDLKAFAASWTRTPVSLHFATAAGRCPPL